MGRRSINTTKSGKYMNPTDQARKEARKRELKKNKKQRIMVRMAVLKGKDPLKLIEEMDAIDEMEYDPTQPPKLSERVLKDKRRKLKETFERVLRMYEKEDPEYALELKRQQAEYVKRHQKRIQYYNEVKNAEQVELDQIPLPDMPAGQPMTSQIPLPSDIPLPHVMTEGDLQPKGILKKTSAYERPGDTPMAVSIQMPKRKPPGPPPGPPPPLSDVEDEENEESETTHNQIDPGAIPRPPGGPPDVPPGLSDKDLSSFGKQKKIRFEDSSCHSTEDEGDAPLKYKHPVPVVSALQVKMLRLAGQDIPGMDITEKEEGQYKRDDKRRDRDDDLGERHMRRQQDDFERQRRHYSDSEESGNEEEIIAKDDDKKQEVGKQNAAVPPGPPPGLPPGPPPGLPPMMFRPPPLRAPPGAPPRMLPPGPPPGRPPGMPPGPPPGLPPTMRAMIPRLPPGPGAPPPRLVRPPGGPPGVAPPGVTPAHSAANPNVLSAPPSIMKPASKGTEEKKNVATIEAKPKIKNWKGDVTRFLPTALKIKREIKDAKGRIIRPAAPAEESKTVKSNPTVQAQTKDDAYEKFMKEMEGLL